MKETLPFYVFTLGKLADYVLTIHGLRLGYTELNMFALNPAVIAASLIMYPVFLYVVCLAAGKHPWRSLVLFPGLAPLGGGGLEFGGSYPRWVSHQTKTPRQKTKTAIMANST